MNWHTETRKISELKNWESNPRVISEESYEELKESIGSLGNFEPLVINIDGTVLAGNQRLRVAKERGDKEVEVSVPERELTEQEIKKIGIISNRHSGEWDMDKLANEFEDVLGELGFDDLLPEVELEVKEDDYEEPEDLETTVVLGDVYQLGEHRLMCGDSTKIEDVEKLMNGQKADMVFTDPPYNALKSWKKDEAKGETRLDPSKWFANDNMEWDDFEIFISKCFTNLSGHSVYICCDYRIYPLLTKLLLKTPYTLKHCIVWKKNIWGLGKRYRFQHEFIIYACIDKAPFCGDRSQSDVWEVDVDREQEHNTPKPVRLCAKAIENSSEENEKILDLFGGSGSTLIACEQTNRKCYMMEIDPYYCQVIIDRWEKFTGKEAIKLK